jgi:hypothetical protein
MAFVGFLSRGFDRRFIAMWCGASIARRILARTAK